MRRILIERARQKATLKQGGDRERIELNHIEPAVLPLSCDDILGLEDALLKMEQEHPRKAELVKLRFFAGLTMDDVTGPRTACMIGSALNGADAVLFLVSGRSKAEALGRLLGLPGEDLLPAQRVHPRGDRLVFADRSAMGESPGA